MQFFCIALYTEPRSQCPHGIRECHQQFNVCKCTNPGTQYVYWDGKVPLKSLMTFCLSGSMAVSNLLVRAEGLCIFSQAQNLTNKCSNKSSHFISRESVSELMWYDVKFFQNKVLKNKFTKRMYPFTFTSLGMCDLHTDRNATSPESR